jgi:hypothetical protein
MSAFLHLLAAFVFVMGVAELLNSCHKAFKLARFSPRENIIWVVGVCAAFLWAVWYLGLRI